MKTLRQIRAATFSIDPRTAKVYWDCEERNYIVKFFISGIRQKESDYFTSDRQDAIGTATTWVNEQQQGASHERSS